MTDEQAKELIRLLRGMQMAIWGLAIVGALYVGISFWGKISPPRVDATTQELSAIRTELQLLRTQQQQNQIKPPIVIDPKPK